jgi:hypothetical protein
VFGASGAPVYQALAVTSTDGPALPEGGLVGRLVFLNSDVTGCSGVITQLNVQLKAARAAADGLHPIVLLERSEASEPGACSFEDKVLAVQDAGAMAAVVFDNVAEGPVQMVYADPVDVAIPAAFISYQDGMALLAAMASCHGGEPVSLLAPSLDDGNGTPGRAAAARFEVVSFSAGYLLLFACLLPVAAVGAARLVKRRESVEAAFAVVARDPAMAAQVASQLDPKHLPLPLARGPQPRAQDADEPGAGGGAGWASARRFLSLALAIYVVEMLFFAAVVDADGRVAAEDPSVPAATAFGINCAINALLGAALLTAAHRCVRSLCCCGDPQPAGAAAAEDEGAGFPGAAARAAREAEEKKQPLIKAPKGEKRRKPVQAELSVAEYVELPSPGYGYTPPAFTTQVHAQDQYA